MRENPLTKDPSETGSWIDLPSMDQALIEAFPSAHLLVQSPGESSSKASQLLTRAAGDFGFVARLSPAGPLLIEREIPVAGEHKLDTIHLFIFILGVIDKLPEAQAFALTQRNRLREQLLARLNEHPNSNFPSDPFSSAHLSPGKTRFSPEVIATLAQAGFDFPETESQSLIYTYAELCAFKASLREKWAADNRNRRVA